LGSTEMRVKIDVTGFLLAILIALTMLWAFSVTAWRGSSTPSPSEPSSVSATWSYKFFGAETSYGGSQGVCAEISVTNPSVPHDQTPDDFFYAWIMVYSSNRTKWIQVGWSEVSWKPDAQYVTEYDTEHNYWHFFYQYPLIVGHSYYFAISTLGSGSWESWIWWNNRWNLLAQANIQLQSAERTGEFCEVCTSTNNWFNVPTTTFHSTCLLTGNRWSLWTAQQSTTLYGSNVPYAVYWSTQYSNWCMNKSDLA
jgi:hypothetical protein